MDAYLWTDANIDVISCLSHCARSLLAVSDNIEEWKWVLVAAHGALQGALVVELAGTDGIGALSEKSQKLMFCWHEKDGKGELNWINNVDEDGLPIKTPKNPKPYPDPSLRSVGMR